MISDNYRQQSYLILEEIFNMITDEIKEKMHRIITDPKREKLLISLEDKFLKENLIEKFIKSTPTQRLAVKQWWNKTENKKYLPWLIYFSFKYVQMGHFLLNEISQLPENGGYREVVSIYSVNCRFIRQQEIPELFFDSFLSDI